MLKRPITYEDFDGVSQTDIYYFNMSERELIEMEVRYEKGFAAMIQSVIDTKDDKAIIGIFQEIIMLSYGVKSTDAKSFEKSDELRAKFAQTAAYNALFMELATDESAGATFVIGVLPKSMGAEVTKAMAAKPPLSTVPTTE